VTTSVNQHGLTPNSTLILFIFNESNLDELFLGLFLGFFWGDCVTGFMPLLVTGDTIWPQNCVIIPKNFILEKEGFFSFLLKFRVGGSVKLKIKNVGSAMN